MKHEKAKRFLPDYAVGRLGGRRKAKIEQHIRECPICEMDLRELQQMDKLLREVGLLRPSNPQLLLNRVRKATLQSQKPSRQILSWQFSWRWLLKPALAVAIFTLLTAVALVSWRQTSEQTNLTVSHEQYHRLVSWGNPLGNWIEVGIDETSKTQ